MTAAERYQKRRAEKAVTTAEAILYLIESIIHE